MQRQLAGLFAAFVLCSLPAGPALSQKLDEELKGITAVGLVVEDLGPHAAACGLKRDALEAAASKILADAGLKVARSSDNDTYVYLNVQTTSVPGGLCASRYDAYLYTNTTARLSYQATPLLVQVSLIHEGGLSGGGPATHGPNLTRSLMQYVEQIAQRIKRANQ